MDFSLVIRHRMQELGLEQRDLAKSAQVTESYISQLLSRRKAPPAPGRTDIYERIGALLKFPDGELQKLANTQRQEHLKRKFVDPAAPLFKGVRELVIRKCKSEKQNQVRTILEKQPFGELERLITQKLLDVVKKIAKEELDSEDWLHLMAGLSNRNYEEFRVAILEFLDTDVLDLSVEDCVHFLDPVIESWDIDLATFSVEIVLNRRVSPRHARRFEFVEREPESEPGQEPGLKQFLQDPSLSRDITDQEVEFLRRLQFEGKHPTPLYYYRELQNLRDPLHFYEGNAQKGSPRRGG
ncbi:MAG: helix-turn-helix transcriptional regulator [Acidobacteriota bacterium]